MTDLPITNALYDGLPETNRVYADREPDLGGVMTATYNNPGLPASVPDTPCWSGVGKGWWPVVEATHKAMIRVAPNYGLDQVKEKFGGLRYYWNLPSLWDKMPEDADESWEPTPEDTATFKLAYEQLTVLAGLAEAICSHICETCGRVNEVSDSGGWLSNVCEPCSDAFKAKRAAESAFRKMNANG